MLANGVSPAGSVLQIQMLTGRTARTRARDSPVGGTRHLNGARCSLAVPARAPMLELWGHLRGQRGDGTPYTLLCVHKDICRESGHRLLPDGVIMNFNLSNQEQRFGVRLINFVGGKHSIAVDKVLSWDLVCVITLVQKRNPSSRRPLIFSSHTFMGIITQENIGMDM